jgi:hypothetical protein
MRTVALIAVIAILVLAGATLSVAIRTVFLVKFAIFGAFLLAAGALIFSAWWAERRRLP